MNKLDIADARLELERMAETHGQQHYSKMFGKFVDLVEKTAEAVGKGSMPELKRLYKDLK